MKIVFSIFGTNISFTFDKARVADAISRHDRRKLYNLCEHCRER